MIITDRKRYEAEKKRCQKQAQKPTDEYLCLAQDTPNPEKNEVWAMVLPVTAHGYKTAIEVTPFYTKRRRKVS